MLLSGDLPNKSETSLPLVSIVVPAYNAADTIERCLTSLTAQSLSSIEIMVVNDGSVDNTASIVASLAKKDTRIRLINRENGGSGAARNTGIDNTIGRFLAFVDSDDTIEPRMLETMVDAAIAHNATVVACQADNLLYKNGAPYHSLGSFELPGDKDVVSGTEAASWLFDFIAPNMNSMCFKLVARSLLDKSGIRFPENKRCVEDMPVSAGILLNANRVALIRQNLYHYIHEGETRSTSYSPQSAMDIIFNLQDIRDYAKLAGYPDSLDNFTLGMCFSAEKHITWADSQAEDCNKALSLIAKEKSGHKPDFSRRIPFVQKAKIICAYRNLTPTVCGALKKLKRIPIMKYLI